MWLHIFLYFDIVKITSEPMSCGFEVENRILKNGNVSATNFNSFEKFMEVLCLNLLIFLKSFLKHSKKVPHR